MSTEMHGETGGKARRKVVLAVVATLSIAAFAAGCGDDEDGATGTTAATGEAPTATPTATTGATPAQNARASAEQAVFERARQKGAEACANKTPAEVVDEYMAAFRTADDKGGEGDRQTILAQIEEARRASPDAPVPPGSAAALYTLSQPRAERGGAYQGCLERLATNAR